MRLGSLLLLLATASVHGQEKTGVGGVVLTPDGVPVTTGNVALLVGAANTVNAAIDREGRFHLVPETAGRQPLFISVPGFTPYRVYVTVPESKRMALPPITLLPPTYVRARFVTPEGEVISPIIRRRSIDAEGMTIRDPIGSAPDHIDHDGTITIGPLPPGRALLAFDRGPFAQTRLQDVQVTNTGGLIDLGTIVIHPGGTLHVDVVNAAGAPVPRHDVWIEDAVQPTALVFTPTRTNNQGRATFQRLAGGRYRVWSRMADFCNGQTLNVSRLVSVANAGEARARLVVSGRATFRFVWPLGALAGRSMSASPDTPTMAAPWLPAGVPSRSTSCGALTDGDGRVTLDGFPPGATLVSVSLFNSRFSRMVTVPDNGREVVIEIPDGLLPVRVINSATSTPVGSARVTWKGTGGSVEAITTANGDALLESIGAAGGTLAVSMRDYEDVEGSFDEAPTAHQEIPLEPLPSQRVQVRVVNEAGRPVAGALLHLLPATPAEPGDIATADEKGTFTFVNIRPGVLRLSVSADGFRGTDVQIAEENRLAVAVTLAREP